MMSQFQRSGKTKQPRSYPVCAPLVLALAVVVIFASAQAASGSQSCSADEPGSHSSEGIGTAQGTPSSENRGDSAQGMTATSAEPSYFTRLWELDEASRAGRRFINPHRPFYALVFSYNTSPNLAPFLEVDPDKTLTKAEVTFQLSFKTKIWEDVLGRGVDLWFGYTQRSFWQLYNFDDSSPFRETNYEPEVLFNIRTRLKFLGFELKFVTLGLNHQSNGQVEPVSRSWNRLVADFGVERGNLSLLLKAWFRIPESIENNDNPRMGRYLGNGELWLHYFHKKHHFAAMVRNNLNFAANRGAVQIEWSYPLIAQVGIYAQCFFGYGESLIDYNHKTNRIGVGFVLWE